MTDARARAIHSFEQRFGRRPTLLAHAPGRVNLIGEHTDYNDGFVLPMALERAAWIASDRRDDGAVNLVAADLAREGSFRLDDVATDDAVVRSDGSDGRPPAELSWLEYPLGVAWSLAQAGYELEGFDGALASDVPRGAGLSSSAAVELSVAATFLRPGEPAGWDVRAVARAMQRAENDWVGVASGIMDQLIGTAAMPGHAVLIDCRSLHLMPVKLPADAAVVVLDTGTRRGLVDSAYNARRAACERVAATLGVPALRDLSLADLADTGASLDPTDVRRARHVIAENDRTLAAATALTDGDLAAAGSLMRASHMSLRDLYEVSSPALDALVEAAAAAPGCYGARMTGAGFGGCAVALVDSRALSDFVAKTVAGYHHRTGYSAVTYVGAAGPGAGSTAL